MKTIKQIVLCDARAGFEFLYVRTSDGWTALRFRPDGAFTGMDVRNSCHSKVEDWDYTIVYDAAMACTAHDEPPQEKIYEDLPEGELQ